MGAKAKVFVALDYGSEKAAWPLVERLMPINPYFKVGLELFVAEGPNFVQKLSNAGAKVFLDLKFHDISNTVAGAVRSSVRLGVDYLNVHCGGGLEMMRQAAVACQEESARLAVPRPTLLGVTVLTSLNDKDVEEIGFPRSSSAQVKHFVELAQLAGLDGVVCSAHELPLVANIAGKTFQTMVPGIRPAGSAQNDQSRTMTPAEAVAAGAHCLVVGRPVTAAQDPLVALKSILEQI